MKKIILIAAAVLGFALAASAQPRAIGGRLGWATEVSYQHTISGTNFVEVNTGLLGLGLGNFFAYGVAASYNFIIAQPEWTNKGEWGFYAGPGVSLNQGYKTNNKTDIVTASFNIAAMAQVGLEYTFWFPLQLSVDIRPMLGISISGGAQFFAEGLNGLAPTFSVRYRL